MPWTSPPSLTLKQGAIAVALLVLEGSLPRGVARGALEPNVRTGVPPAFSVVVAINVVLSNVVLIALGERVGAARKRYNVALPHLYAPGSDVNAVKFNCAQRGHLHALETYSQFLALSLLAGVRFPLTTTAAGLVWAAARWSYAAGYAKGPEFREGGMGKHVWTPVVWLSVAAIAATATMVMARPRDE